MACAMLGQSRQRDILPLPHFDAPLLDRSVVLSRGTRRRIIKRNHNLNWANDAITSLNALGGHGTSAPDDLRCLPVGSLAALEEVSQAFHSVGSPVEPLLTPDGALRELLHSTSIYAQDRLDVKPYDKDLVSWPPVGSSACDLRLGLPEADRTMLAEWNTRMLRTDPPPPPQCNVTQDTHHDIPCTVKKAYCDPALFRSGPVYADFLQRLDAGGMIHWMPARGRKGVLGVFFVAKKNGSLRLIFDTRTLNQDFADPPHTALPSGAAFSNIELPDKEEFVFGAFDIQNAFYVLGIPLDLAERFTLPAISNKHIGFTHLHDTSVAPSEMLLPCLKVLPMGWSWSLYLCQQFTSTIVSRHVPYDNMILDKKPGVVLSKPTDTAVAAYVDNVAKLLNLKALQPCGWTKPGNDDSQSTKFIIVVIHGIPNLLKLQHLCFA